MKAGSFDLVRDLQDRQLEDCHGTPCGMVDDVELERDAAGRFRVVALLVGAGAWIPRLPALLQAPARQAFGKRVVRVPWAEIEYISEHVRLKRAEGELGLRFREPRLQQFLERIPGNDKTEPA